jgi:hypothetical protein
MGRAHVPQEKKGRRDRMGWCGTGTRMVWNRDTYRVWLPGGKVCRQRGQASNQAAGRGWDTREGSLLARGGTATCWPGKGGRGCWRGAGAFVGEGWALSCKLGHAAGHAATKWADRWTEMRQLG